MTSYVAKGSVKRDGKYIKPGEPVNVSGKEAEELLAAGAIEKKGEDGTTAAPVPVAENTAPRLPASGETKPADPDDLAKDAKPGAAKR
jgi:hypothetical protein